MTVGPDSGTSDFLAGRQIGLTTSERDFFATHRPNTVTDSFLAKSNTCIRQVSVYRRISWYHYRSPISFRFKVSNISGNNSFSILRSSKEPHFLFLSPEYCMSFLSLIRATSFCRPRKLRTYFGCLMSRPTSMSWGGNTKSSSFGVVRSRSPMRAPTLWGAALRLIHWWRERVPGFYSSQGRSVLC